MQISDENVIPWSFSVGLASTTLLVIVIDYCLEYEFLFTILLAMCSVSCLIAWYYFSSICPSGRLQRASQILLKIIDKEIFQISTTKTEQNDFFDAISSKYTTEKNELVIAFEDLKEIHDNLVEVKTLLDNALQFGSPSDAVVRIATEFLGKTETHKLSINKSMNYIKGHSDWTNQKNNNEFVQQRKAAQDNAQANRSNANANFIAAFFRD